MAKDAQLTPFRSTLYSAKLESYRAIRASIVKDTKLDLLPGMMEVIIPNGCKIENGVAVGCHATLDVLESNLVKYGARAAARDKRKVIDLVDALDSQSVVWNGLSSKALSRLRRALGLQGACVAGWLAVLDIIRLRDELLPLDVYVRDCRRAKASTRAFTVLIENTDAILKLDLRTDQLQIVPVLANKYKAL